MAYSSYGKEFMKTDYFMNKGKNRDPMGRLLKDTDKQHYCTQEVLGVKINSQSGFSNDTRKSSGR